MKYENELHERGVRYIAGVDEVGRGPLAGPVVAAAVVLPADFFVPGLDDSKKLTAKKREKLFDIIAEQSLAYGIGMIDNVLIDKINILEATKEAMKEAIENAEKALRNKTGSAIGHLLIDAVFLSGMKIPQTSIIKGDEQSVSIAAASIIAKVTRDRMMLEYNDIYPYYGFNNNKGYGTKAHYDGISRYGICKIHRRSFLKNIYYEGK